MNLFHALSELERALEAGLKTRGPAIHAARIAIIGGLPTEDVPSDMKQRMVALAISVKDEQIATEEDGWDALLEIFNLYREVQELIESQKE